MPLAIRRPTATSNTQPSLCCRMATVFNRNSRSPQRNLKRQQACSDENTSQHDQPRKPASRDHSASPARLRLLLFFGTCCAHELRLRRLSELNAPRIDNASRMNREIIIDKAQSAPPWAAIKPNHTVLVAWDCPKCSQRICKTPVRIPLVQWQTVARRNDQIEYSVVRHRF